MNLLALANQLMIECGVSGSALTTTKNQVGDPARLVNWIKNSWLDIQGVREDWGWMFAKASFPTVNLKASYTPVDAGIVAGTFARWALGTFRCSPTATGVNGEMDLDDMEYMAWRSTYYLGNQKNVATRPMAVAVGPDDSLWLGPVPAVGYTVTGHYYTAPVALVEDTDIPAVPAQYHMLIVYRAMMHYGAFEAASEVYQRGEAEYKRLMRRLTNHFTGMTIGGGSLA